MKPAKKSRKFRYLHGYRPDLLLRPGDSAKILVRYRRFHLAVGPAPLMVPVIYKPGHWPKFMPPFHLN